MTDNGSSKKLAFQQLLPLKTLSELLQWKATKIKPYLPGVSLKSTPLHRPDI